MTFQVPLVDTMEEFPLLCLADLRSNTAPEHLVTAVSTTRQLPLLDTLIRPMLPLLDPDARSDIFCRLLCLYILTDLRIIDCMMISGLALMFQMPLADALVVCCGTVLLVAGSDMTQVVIFSGLDIERVMTVSHISLKWLVSVSKSLISDSEADMTLIEAC